LPSVLSIPTVDPVGGVKVRVSTPRDGLSLFVQCGSLAGAEPGRESLEAVLHTVLGCRDAPMSFGKWMSHIEGVPTVGHDNTATPPDTGAPR